MIDLWSRLERQLAIHAPQLGASLRPGVAELELSAFEQDIGQRLPDEWREAYLRHDGCVHNWDENAVGLFSEQQWLPISEVREAWRWNRDGFDEAAAYHYGEEDEAWNSLPVRPWQYPPPQWIPIGQQMGTPSVVFVDMLPGPMGVPAQLVCQNYSSISTSIVSRSLTEYLLYLVTGLEQGQVFVGTVPYTELRRWSRNDGVDFSAPGNVHVW